ncbi:ethylene receptor 2 [Phtheirospermum japonicum]|uniref:Ethylene receptor n=1 Tax=Phtheirospermum japonicum TaxID=374723 RepID=A0A830BDX5_9LAMI|nr:ethylene receptor 2 [Phtheirospermum japonicum]
MSKALASVLLALLLLLSVSAAADDGNDTPADDDGSRCNCEDEGFWSIETILNCQRVSDFMIAVAYFSIPIELLYFLSCSTIPFKWVIVEFIAFIVLCGMTHFLNGWTYGPHPFQIMLALTVFKLLTALVSFATAITLVSLLPLLLKTKVRELLLKKKTTYLDQEVAKIMKQKEDGLHVRMLTQEIRKSLDRHTILDTTLVELSKALDLQSCAIWMPNAGRTEMNLTHDLKGRIFSNNFNSSIPYGDPDVLDIKKRDGVKILDPDSALAVASSGGPGGPGAVAAIRMPMLRVSNFKGGTPEMVPACYAILVLVLPSGECRFWGDQELEIVEVVADQVAVAISHAAVLEESQNMRDKLAEQNRALEQSRQDALMASQARVAFEMVMSNGLRRPMHSILGLLSVLQDESLNNEQRLLVDTMVKTSNVLSTLITDVMGTSAKERSRLGLEMRYFQLHMMIKEAACLSKCLCSYRGYDFVVEVEKLLPNHVMGDERRVFQVVLHMVRHLLDRANGGGCLTLRVYSAGGSQGGWSEQRWAHWRLNSSEGYVHTRFEVGIRHSGSQSESVLPVIPYGGGQRYYGALQESLSFTACKKLVQLMQGDIWVTSNPEGFDESMALVLRFHVRPPVTSGVSEHGESSFNNRVHSNSLLRGLKVLLADADDVNRAVTRKLLEKLGCVVDAVSSGYECLSAVGPATSSCRIVLMDLQLPDLDGYEVTMRIRKFRSRSWPLIVALTANDDGDIMDRCMQVGMNGVIQKPGTLQEISDELNRILLQRG